MDRKSFGRLMLFNTTFPNSSETQTESKIYKKSEWNTEIDGQLINLQKELAEYKSPQQNEAVQ